MAEIIKTQSGLKEMEDPDWCPKQWYAKFVTKEARLPPNEPMKKGLYFEHMAIGSGSNNGNEEEDFIPSGRLPVAYSRLNEQAELFKEFVDPDSDKFLGYKINEEDIQLEMEVGDKRGTIDFSVTEVETGDLYLSDLKSTADIENDRPPYGWGNYESMDLVQAVYYSKLYEELTGVKPAGFIYWVFDYSTSKGVKIIRITDFTPQSVSDMERRFDGMDYVIEHYENEGWVASPSEDKCADCPLQCDARIKKPLAEIIDYIY